MNLAGKKLAQIVIILSVTPMCLSNSAFACGIREVTGTARALIPIQTALGFSTILEFPSKPLSAVLGDQDGFKLEYVANSITLKPLINGAKSNLFVFTDSGRFNFSIQSGTSSAVDYIVTIKSTDDVSHSQVAEHETDPYRVVLIKRKSGAHGLILKVNQLKIARDSNNPRAASLIEFEISSENQTYPFQASAIGIKQNGKFISAESIYLDQLSVSPANVVHGVIAILNQEWKPSFPISVVFAVSQNDPKKKKSKTYRIEVIANPNPKPVNRKGVDNEVEKLFPKIHA